MRADLLVKGGIVVDGSGLPGYRADVAVVDGRIVEIGRLDCSACSVLNAEGCVVAPGFIDIHTHYDAQLHFEPSASPSSWHGVTTVLGGNCGFSLAPAKPRDVPWLLEMLSRVEGMSQDALRAGVDFKGGGFGEFLDGLEGRIGINFGCFVGHAAVRRWSMGEAASERVATADEVGTMKELVDQSMREGALGFSSSQLTIHADHNGRPVPPNWASEEELVALASVLKPFAHGVIEFFPETMGEGYSQADRALMLAMSTASGHKPMAVNPLTLFPGHSDTHRRALEFAEVARASGHRIHPQFQFHMRQVVWSLDSTFLLDEMPTFRATLSLKGRERISALHDAAVRGQMKRELADTRGRMVVFDWSDTLIASVANEQNATLVGLSIAELAAERGVDALDALLDLAVSEDLKTVFSWERALDPTTWKVIADLIRHPLTLAGSSDGGAHLLTFCGADYPTRLLIDAVPEVLTLEAAVARLTLQPAVLFGLWDRGMIAVGKVADLVIFDPDELAVEPLAFRRDFPTGAERVVIGAQGYLATVVNGEIVFRSGEFTDALPGVVLRPGR